LFFDLKWMAAELGASAGWPLAASIVNNEE
jgi:hypothetical protein